MTQLHSLSKGPRNIDQACVLRAQHHVTEGSNLLSELSQHCCLPDRSQVMNDSLTVVTKLAATLKSDSVETADVVAAIDTIEALGGSVGKLYATCCTPVRQPLYEGFYCALHKAHLSLNRALGIGH